MDHAALKRWLPLLLFGAALLAAFVVAHQQGLTIGAALRWLYVTAHGAPWLLLLMFVLRPPFILPISGLVLLSGMLWGLVAGGACAVTGMLLSAASSYAIARYVVPPTQVRAAAVSGFEIWLERLRREGFMTVVLMRLSLMPFDVVNFAAAALRVEFRSFFLATVLGNTVATLIYASVGASVRVEAFMGGGALPPLKEMLDWRQLLITLILLIASLWLARHFKRRRSNRAAAESLKR